MKTNPDVIQELAENELRISLLYHKYSQTFQEKKDFWDHIYWNEIHHNQMLNDLLENERRGTLLIDRKRFRTKTVELVRAYIQENLDKAQQGPKISFKDALIVAENIENSLLEKTSS